MRDAPVAASVAISVAASLCFGLLAPVLARRVRPGVATWLLSTGSFVLAASTVVTLALVVVPAAGTVPAVAAAGHWSAGQLRSSAPFAHGVARGVAAVLAVLAVAGARAGWRWGGAVARAWRASRALGEPLVVLPDRALGAFALPGRPGRIVATAGLLRDLRADERRAVLEHEQAHLDGRHELHLALGALASALDPLLVRIPAALRLATERWADERAAAATGDRELVARTIGKVAAAGPVGRRGLVLLAAARGDVPARVAALLRGAPGRRPLAETLLLACVVAGVGGALLTAHEVERLFDAATHAYLVGHLAGGRR